MAKIVIIDEKGKLFGLINLLDLIVIISLLVLLYLGSSAYLALKTSTPQLVDFSPKRINNEKANSVTLVLKNDRRIGSAKVTMIPHRFEGERLQPRTSIVKAKRNEITVSIPAGAAAGNYLFELELVVFDALNRQSTHVLNFSKPLVIEQEKELVIEQEKEVDLYPWPIEVDVLFPGDSSIIKKQIKTGDTMEDSHGRLIAEVLSVRSSRSSDTLNLAGKPWKQEEIPDQRGLTARLRLQPEILENRLAFQGNTIGAGQQIKFNTGSTALEGYIIGKAEVKYQKINKGQEVLADVLMLGVRQENINIIKPNYTQIDHSGAVWAEIIEVTEEESRIRESYRNVEVRMLLNCYIHNRRFYCQKVLIEPGAILNFTLKRQTVTGLVQKIFYPQWIKVVVEFKNVTPEIAELLRGGIREEVSGRSATMSIEKIISSHPSYSYNPILSMEGPPVDGKRTFLGHPENRDIKCLMNIKAIRAGKKVYYNKEQLMISSSIVFQTSTWRCGGEIIQFLF